MENAVELGVNFLDTADIYGAGYGEEILTKALGHRRHDLVIATKFSWTSTTKARPGLVTSNVPRSSTRISSASPASKACVASAPTISTSIRFTTPESTP